MKYYHNSKVVVRRHRPYIKPGLFLIVAVGLLVCASGPASAPYKHWTLLARLIDRVTFAHTSPPESNSNSLASTPHVIGQTTTKSSAPQFRLNQLTFAHFSIVTTIFWVGEPADKDNGYIANAASAWDGQWQQHFGGVDDPNSRNGFQPAAFTPTENPFYFALPYSDLTNQGVRKPSAVSCPLSSSLKSQPYSWCKNAWIAIRHGSKVAYAQWEDVGPYQEDDTAYVFGGAMPKNTRGAKAGLDVSPAVRDYLGLSDVDTTDWAFVDEQDVPSGPWLTIMTTGKGDTVS